MRVPFAQDSVNGVPPILNPMPLPLVFRTCIQIPTDVLERRDLRSDERR